MNTTVCLILLLGDFKETDQLKTPSSTMNTSSGESFALQ